MNTPRNAPELLALFDDVFDEENLYRLLPDHNALLKAKKQHFLDEVSKQGYNHVHEPQSGARFHKAPKPPGVRLPPFIRVGQLHRTSATPFSDIERAETINIPALLTLNDVSAILSYSDIDHVEMAKQIQAQAIRMILSINPSATSCAGLDLADFGHKFQLIKYSIPNFTAIIDNRSVESFFSELETEMAKRNSLKGIRNEFLYQYNEDNKDSLIPYLFIFITCYEQDLPNQDLRKCLQRFLNNNNSAKAGIYFFINFSDPEVCKQFREGNPLFPI
ncbi:MAG: hypothetical protein ACO21O_10815, partial [Steroidobacteraceae bacterium]